VALNAGKRRSQVVSAAGEEVFFKIKRNTKLSKLQGAYANKVGKDVGSIRCGSVSFFPFSPVSRINAGCFTLVQFFIFNEKKKNPCYRGIVFADS
jgi:Ubiquitin-2 like Rad60 SUMO-like